MADQRHASAQAGASAGDHDFATRGDLFAPVTSGAPLGQAPIQPRAGGLPVPRYGRARHRQRDCDLLLGQAAEVAEFDNLDLTRIEARQFGQGLIDQQQLAFPRLDGTDVIVERDFERRAWPFRGLMRPRVVDQNAPHHLRRDAEKMRPILPNDAPLS